MQLSNHTRAQPERQKVVLYFSNESIVRGLLRAVNENVRVGAQVLLTPGYWAAWATMVSG